MMDTPRVSRGGRFLRVLGSRTRVWITLSILATGAVLLVNRMDLLHIDFADFSDVEVSRYVLGRWPTSWKEVAKACKLYFEADNVRPETEQGFRPMRVEFMPVNSDTCQVTFHFRNILGFPYAEKRRLVWSRGREEEIEHNDLHDRVSRDLLETFLSDVRGRNRGIVPDNLASIQAAINDSVESHRRLVVALVPGLAGRKLAGIPPDTPCLRFTFAGGVSRHGLVNGKVTAP